MACKFFFLPLKCLKIHSCTAIRCFCSGHCPAWSGNGSCVTRPGGYCYAFVQEVVVPETNRLEAEFSYGCLPPDESGYMQCQGDLSPHAIPRSIKCCRDRDNCNRDLKPQYKSSIAEPDPSLTALISNQMLLYMLPVAIAAILLLILLVVVLKVRAMRRDKSSCNHSIASSRGDCDSYDGRYSSPENGFTNDITNSSGAKVPLLVDRTIARDLGQHRPLARGRYGQVSVVWLRGAQVAMKEFSTTEEASWKREHDIYKTTLLQHENILGYIAPDIRGYYGVTKMLLLTDFHEKGSLFDFLSRNSVDERIAFRFMLTIARGLDHLHKEIIGKLSKPAIAHRDLKSKNILVKNDLTCCIADFGLSVTVADTSELHADNIKVGTKRYMAPEVLDGSMVTADFESYKRADIYALSLVLWEIMRRIHNGLFFDLFSEAVFNLFFFAGEKCDDYQIPYQGLVPNDPSFEEMKKLVCDQRVRPPVKLMWEENWRPIVHLMREGWSGNCKVRPTAQKMKKIFSECYTHLVEEMTDRSAVCDVLIVENEEQKDEKKFMSSFSSPSSSSSSDGQSGYEITTPIYSKISAQSPPLPQSLDRPDLIMVV